jgi:hypothetical protein
VDQGGLDDLMLVAALLYKTTGAMELLRAEVAGAVYCGNIEACERAILFEPLAPLELMEEVRKNGRQMFRVKPVQGELQGASGRVESWRLAGAASGPFDARIYRNL